jgi:glucose-1-phosphate cytidylyltransferase
MKTVILAGGFGTRLAERTDELPKPMVEIGPQPILWHILKTYSAFGFNDFIIAAGYRSEMIKRYFLDYRLRMSDIVFNFADTDGQAQHINTRVEPWRIAVIDTGERTMTGGRLRRLGDHLDAGITFMMTYGDGVADVDLLDLVRFHKSHGRLATFTGVIRPDPWGVPTIEGDRVTSFAEKPARQGEWISAGFFVLETSVVDRIHGDEDSFELQTLPQLARDGQLMVYKHTGFWHPMDTLRDVRKLNALWAENKAPWKVWT